MMNQRQLFRFLRNEQMRGCGNGGWAAFRRFFRFRLTKGSDCDIIAMLSGCGAVGSALPWGGRGRPFKSGHSDQSAEPTAVIAPMLLAWELLVFLPHADSARALSASSIYNCISTCADRHGCFFAAGKGWIRLKQTILRAFRSEPK